MTIFQTILQKFGEKGEKTGWTYLEIPAHIAHEIKSDCKVSFRVKGMIDNFPVKLLALLPMGEGDFIMPVNATMRKGIKKQKGEKIIVQLELDKAELKINSDFLSCIADEPKAKAFFDKLPKSHQNYYSKWIDSAKTDETKAKRIAQSMNGFKMGMNFPEMLRHYKANKL